jgi:hypothetical protein
MRPSPSRIGPPKGKSTPVDGLLAFHASPVANRQGANLEGAFLKLMLKQYGNFDVDKKD